MSSRSSVSALDRLRALHGETDGRFTSAVAGLPVGCGSGCFACCQDGLTVWEVEAAAIEAHVRELALQVSPSEGAGCAFLDRDGRCQVYDARPYVCRSQGAVLRWSQSAGDGAADPTSIGEARATCDQHLQGVSLDTLPLAQTFALGPAESALVTLATEHHAEQGRRGLPERVALRTLAEGLAQLRATPDTGPTG